MVRPIDATPQFPPNEASSDPKQQFLHQLNTILTLLNSINFSDKAEVQNSLQEASGLIEGLKNIQLPISPFDQNTVEKILSHTVKVCSGMITLADKMPPDKLPEAGPAILDAIKTSLKSLDKYLGILG